MLDMKIWGPIIVSCIMMIIGIASYLRSGKHDTESYATRTAQMDANISYIRASVDEIKVEQRMTRTDVKELETRIAKAEASTASAHKRLDDHINKGVDSR